MSSRRVTQKFYFLWCFVSPVSTRLSCHITCTFKRKSFRLFIFKISQFVPDWIKNPQKSIENMQKGDKLWYLNLNNRETQALKGTCYITKKSIVLMGETIEKINFLSNLLPTLSKISFFYNIFYTFFVVDFFFLNGRPFSPHPLSLLMAGQVIDKRTLFATSLIKWSKK